MAAIDDALLERVSFRGLQPADRGAMAALHRDLFPVPYSDAFFDDMVEHKGIHGGYLFAAVAEDVETAEVVGFVLAQLFAYPDKCEDADMFGTPEPTKVCYILTLGCVQRFRRLGLGSALIEHCKDYALSNPGCGGLYLHVIDYNAAAIAFYEKNGFEMVRGLDDFYHFDQKYWSAYLYVLYLPGYQPTVLHRMWGGIRKAAASGIEFVTQLISLFAWADGDSDGGSLTAMRAEGETIAIAAAPVAPLAPDANTV